MVVVVTASSRIPRESAPVAKIRVRVCVRWTGDRRRIRSRSREIEGEKKKSGVLSACNRDGHCIQTTISLRALKTPVNSGRRGMGGKEGVQRLVDSQTGGRGPDQCSASACSRGRNGEMRRGRATGGKRERTIVRACV